jgi:immunity protein 51 of polymorphic toxin system
VPAYATIREDGGSFSLSFTCGELPADDAVIAADHEPNGYFWEGVAQFLAPDVAAVVEFDSEGSMFCAYGDRGPLARLQQVLEPCLADPARVRQVIRDATAAGFEFDD